MRKVSHSKLVVPELTAKVQVKVIGLDELKAIVEEVDKLASRLDNLEIQIKTSLPEELKS